MNETTRYEQLMAARLDQVPVPDMADSIWAGIELQLDAEPPAPDQRPTPAQKPVSPIKTMAWYGLAAVVVVTALLWWFFAHKAQEPRPTMPPKPLPETHAPLPKATQPQPPPPASQPARQPASKPTPQLPSPKETPIPIQTTRDTISSHAIPMDSIRVDTVAKRVPPPDVDLYTSPPPRTKKPRGVKGITEDDYKLNAGKH